MAHVENPQHWCRYVLLLADANVTCVIWTVLRSKTRLQFFLNVVNAPNLVVTKDWGDNLLRCLFPTAASQWLPSVKVTVGVLIASRKVTWPHSFYMCICRNCEVNRCDTVQCEEWIWCREKKLRRDGFIWWVVMWKFKKVERPYCSSQETHLTATGPHLP